VVLVLSVVLVVVVVEVAWPLVLVLMTVLAAALLRVLVSVLAVQAHPRVTARAVVEPDQVQHLSPSNGSNSSHATPK
jgi:hypothetical protein